MSSSNAQRIDLHALRSMTRNFTEIKIGSGGYGVVLKGKLNGKEMAVKKLFSLGEVDDVAFDNEFRNLRDVQHKNVIRLIGYCYETVNKDIPIGEKSVWLQQTDRALCFEYMKGGSLANHISDKSCIHDWPTTYKIIKGTCEGLHYLHKGRGENNYIYHLDLKPDNILLDENLVPKIGDFGLSRLFGNSRTHETSKQKGTSGFMPPEYINFARVTPKNDVFSLGVIIFYMLAGKQGYGDYRDLPLRQNYSSKILEDFIQDVLDIWEAKTVGYRWDATDVLGVTKCIKIAMRCVDDNRDCRPSTSEIMEELKNLDAKIEEMLEKDPKPHMSVVPFEELTDLEISVNERSDDDSGPYIVVDPSLELRFPFNPLYPNRNVQCILQLINKAASSIAFSIKTDRNKYRAGPESGILPLGSKCYIGLTLRAPPNMECPNKAIVQATRVPEGFTSDKISPDFFKNASSVNLVTLPIVHLEL